MFDEHAGNAGLEYYNPKPNEPTSSVMESLDYDFSISRYPDGSPLKAFVDAYITAVKNNIGIHLFNCRFERPRTDSVFLNFYIYLRGVEPLELGIFYVIDDNNNHDLKKIFYEVLKNNKLPAIDADTGIQFWVKNFDDNARNRAVSLAWHDIHDTIKAIYPEVALLSFMSYFYVFIDEEIYKETSENTALLKEIKEYCYRAVKKQDIANVWNHDNFFIYVDNYKFYKEIGGHHYFNSDYMDKCMQL